MSLKKETLSGVIWTFAQQFGAQGISFIVSIFLTRLLLPSDFGTITIMDFFMGIGSVLIYSGMASSLIRTQDTDNTDYSTVFYFNLGISLIVYLITFLLSPFIADFYQAPELKNLTRVFCLLFIVTAFTTIQKTLFTKQLKFKKQLTIELPSLIIGAICGIYMAYNDFGVWTLVYYPLITQSLTSIAYWYISDWRPSLTFSKKKLKQHFSYGSFILLAALLDVGFNNFYSLIIGKVFSLESLGYYSKANSLKSLPENNLSMALNKVTFPIFSKIKNNDLKLKEAYSKTMKMVIFILAPLMIFIIVCATPIIRTLYTEKWLLTVPLLQILCVAAIFTPLNRYNVNILLVKGKSDLNFKLNLIKKTILLIIIGITFSFGIKAMLWGLVVQSIIALIINAHFCGKLINLSFKEQFIMISPIILIGGISGGITYLTYSKLLFNLNDFVTIGSCGLLLIFIYIALSKLFKLDSLNEALSLIKEKI